MKLVILFVHVNEDLCTALQQYRSRGATRTTPTSISRLPVCSRSNSQDRCLYLLWHGTEPDGAIPGPRTPSVTQSPSCVSIGESPEAVLLIVSSQLRQTFFAFARGKQTAAGNAMSYSCPSSVRFLCTRLLFKRFCVPTQAFFVFLRV